MKLVSVAEMQAIEREADEAGLSYAQMMRHAGHALGETVQNRCLMLQDGGALGLVGAGNNGGDTLVALTYLAGQGWPVSAYIARSRPQDDPLLVQLVQAGGKIYLGDEDMDHARLTTLVQDHAVLLDGILGTGMRLPLKPDLAMVLAATREACNSMSIPPWIVAVDCPSGVDCDSGAAAPETLPANLTVTMAAVKQGLLKFPAYELVGDLTMVGIGLPGGNLTLPGWRALQRQVADAAMVRGLLPARPLQSHKGTFGTALIAAGSINYTGAPLLAAEAAYRIGAGLVTLAVPGPLHAALAGQIPEATWLLLPHEVGVIAGNAAAIIHKNLTRVTALLVGPGLGLEEPSAEFIARLLGDTHGPSGKIGFVRPTIVANDVKTLLPPLVFDADGLKLLARLPDWPSRLPAPAVLTPHPGEMAVLTGLTSDEIQANRQEIAERYSQQWGHVVVLKGAFTVIASPAGQTTVIPVATPALARAGTGDVLAGLIVGLRAQGVAPFDAAVAAAWIHAQAGLTAARLLGSSTAVLAGDVLHAVATVLAELAQSSH
jgi:ADP-dependent NAD(P)H-hydrate dehydratase / NAD(P)H-hydrate epimerase